MVNRIISFFKNNTPLRNSFIFQVNAIDIIFQSIRSDFEGAKIFILPFYYFAVNFSQKLE